jgi:hypothetical protein
VTTCPEQEDQLEQPAVQVLHGDEQAVVHAGRNVTAWTPQVLHGE